MNANKQANNSGFGGGSGVRNTIRSGMNSGVEDRNDLAMISGLDSGVEVVQRNPVQTESHRNRQKLLSKDSLARAIEPPRQGLDVRESDFEKDHQFGYRLPATMDDSMNQQHDNSIYQEHQREMQFNMIQAAVSQETRNVVKPLSSYNSDRGDGEEVKKLSSTFMGSADEDEKLNNNKITNVEKQEIIQRFEETPVDKNLKQKRKKEGPYEMVKSKSKHSESNEDQMRPQRRQQIIEGDQRVQIDDNYEEDILPKKIGGKKKKKKRLVQQDTDISLEYQRYAESQREEIRGARIYVDRPVIDEPPFQRQQNFEKFQQNFYPRGSYQMLGQGIPSQRSAYQSMRSQVHEFDPQFVSYRSNGNPMASYRQNMLMPENRLMLTQYPDQMEQWVSKPTEQGFLYFHLVGTRTRQWAFPRFYDQEIRKTRPYFVDHWIKKYDNKGNKYWQNMHTKHIQLVKPDQETYLHQAAIAGNLAFIELYIKSKGNLTITDQQRRTALHHAVANGHKEITALLCELCYPMIESTDIKENTPLFMAARYNQVECLMLLISYDCNLFHKLRNGDTCLHVAAAYDSSKCMIPLLNYGGMELFLERNRYNLRAIDIARKMGHHECFAELQNLERNTQYRNAILEREIQSIDYQGVKGARSERNKYLGSGANYPMMSGRARMQNPRNEPVPNLHLSNIGRNYPRNEQRNYNQYQDDSSLMMNNSANYLPFEEDENGANEALESLGGRQGYQRRMQEFEEKTQQMRHEKRYIEKTNKDRQSQKDDIRKRGRRQHDIEFDDYRKNMKDRKTLNKIKEQESFEEVSPQRKRRSQQVVSEKRREAPINSSDITESELDNNRRSGRLSMRKDNIDPLIRKSNRDQRLSSSRTNKKSSSRIFDQQDMEYMQHEYPQSSKRQETSKRNSSNMFKMSIRDDGSIPQHTELHYLQNHLVNRYDQRGQYESENVTDEERDGSRPRSQRVKRSNSVGDPRRMSKGRHPEDNDEEKPTLAEIAYDKTAAIVGTVKELLANGISKIKQLVTQVREKSRTSRSHRGRRSGQSLSEDDSSLDRYKTPMGRSKSRAQSRGFSKVVPIDSPEVQEMLNSEKEERKRHVNFNIERVVAVGPGESDNYSDDDRRERPKSAAASQQRKKTIQIQAEPPQVIKSVLRNGSTQQTTNQSEKSYQVSAKSVGVGSNNINDEILPSVGGGTSSNQDHLLTQQAQLSNNSLQTQQELRKGQESSRTALDKRKKPIHKSIMPIIARKNYQSSEERIGHSRAQQNMIKLNNDEDDQLSQSSQALSQNNQGQKQQTSQQNQQIAELTRQLAPLSKSPPRDRASLPQPKNNQINNPAGKTKQLGARKMSQEQFEMIMMNSEQEQEKPKQANQQYQMLQSTQKLASGINNQLHNGVGDKNQMQQSPQKPKIQPKVDIEQFLEELKEGENDTTDKVVEVATNLPVNIVRSDPEESNNLSNLYNRIMSDHNYDFNKLSPARTSQSKPLDHQVKNQTNLSSNITPIQKPVEEQKLPNQQPQQKEQDKLGYSKILKDNEMSILTEFNPPQTQRFSDPRFDISFQSGITDIRRVLLAEEEFLNQLSDCSFVDSSENIAKEPQPQLESLAPAQSNILDKAQFLNSQNNSIMSQNHNNSQIRAQSAVTRPLAMQLLHQQNNSMHGFVHGLGNSFFGGKCQSDTEENHQQNSNPTGKLLNQSRAKEGPQSLIPGGKKPQLPLSAASANVIPQNTPSKIPTQSQASDLAGTTTQFQAKISSNQSQNPVSSGNNNNGVGGLGIGSTHSDNTSSSAGVVLMSQTSINPRKLSIENTNANIAARAEEAEITPVKPFNKLDFQSSNQQKQLMIELFKEDVDEMQEQQQPSSSSEKIVDETQTDLESGFDKKKSSAKNPSNQHLKALIQELGSNKEEQKNDQDKEEAKLETSEQSSQSATQSEATSMMKKTIMKKLIEIMDDDDEDEKEQSSQPSQGPQQPSMTMIQTKQSPKESKIKPFSNSLCDTPQPQKATTQSKSSNERAASSRRTPRKNTRYGDNEDSLINFDLTSSKIVDHQDDDDEISLIVVNKGGMQSKREYGSKGTSRGISVLPIEIATEIMQSKPLDHDQDLQVQPQQRKSLKMQIQEQIQSIVVSESNSSLGKSNIVSNAPITTNKFLQVKKSHFSEMQAETLPLIILKQAFFDVPKEQLNYQQINEITAETGGVSFANSLRNCLEQKYGLRQLIEQKMRDLQKVGTINAIDDQNNKHINNELETVPEENGESHSHIKNQQSNSMIFNSYRQFEEGKEQTNSSFERQQQMMRTSVIGKRMIVPPLQLQDSPLPTSGEKLNNILCSTTPLKREGSLPPLLKGGLSEDESELTGRLISQPRSQSNKLRDVFYATTKIDSGRDEAGPSSAIRRNSQDREDGGAFPLSSGAAGHNSYIVPQSWREEKQNRSTATPLFSYNTSSDEEGGGAASRGQGTASYQRNKAQRMMQRMLRNQLHSSVTGVPLNSALKQPIEQKQQQQESLPAIQPQKTIKDISFKSQNVSTHTDSSERLKENLRMFSKNRLLQSKKK